MRSKHHRETHRGERAGWLRAAVLGANDGILSTASLIVGVATANASPRTVLTAGFAALVAGAMSMAAGEYVSVSSQRDTERADLKRERFELANDVEGERAELAMIYRKRGLDSELAKAVADQLMAKDALGAHARDELGISELTAARPTQAALTSAAAFSCGSALPLLLAAFSPDRTIAATVTTASILALAALGSIAAKTGGASALVGAIRITVWGILAMVSTAVIGRIFGSAGL